MPCIYLLMKMSASHITFYSENVYLHVVIMRGKMGKCVSYAWENST